jgi:hypothetical protein
MRGVAEPALSVPSTPTFEFSPPLGKLKTRDISFSTQRGIQINSDPRRPSPQSLESTYSYDSYVTGLTSPATSFHDDDEAVGGVASGSYGGDYKERMEAIDGVVDKGKGKATEMDDVVDSSRFATPPLSNRTPPSGLVTPPSTSFSVTNQHSMVMLSASPEGLSHYSPDVADLLHMPPYELERKAFDWDEFERSLRASPGAGPSSGVTPFIPIDSLSGGLGLMLASSSTGINPVDSLDSPEEFNVQGHSPLTQGVSEDHDQAGSSASNTNAIEQITTSEAINPPTVRNTPPGDRRHTVSMFVRPAPEPAPTRTIIHRKSLMLPGSSNTGSSLFARGRIDSIDSASQAGPSRPYSAGASPRGKKRSLILPSWLSKSKENKTGNSTGSHDLEGGRPSHGLSHRPRRLYKDKGRAHTAPVQFPFVITPEAILNAAQPRPGEVESVVAEPIDIKPVEVVSLFETMLPQEIKLCVMARLVIIHQEDFEQRIKEGKWSVAHAKGTRWVGKEAGMRELVKLTRVGNLLYELMGG